jgi:hypothetical protein
MTVVDTDRAVTRSAELKISVKVKQAWQPIPGDYRPDVVTVEQRTKHGWNDAENGCTGCACSPDDHFVDFDLRAYLRCSGC